MNTENTDDANDVLRPQLGPVPHSSTPTSAV